jgi:hypothetical protein
MFNAGPMSQVAKTRKLSVIGEGLIPDERCPS